MFADKRIYRLAAILVSMASLALITAAAKNLAGINAITVALLYLLVVLAVSVFADLACGILTAIASGLLVNYYFLPPFGTFYIEAPADWVSFFAYTATAVVVSHFAATVRRKAVDADRLHAQLSQLSILTDALMKVGKDEMTLELLVKEIRQAYALSYCAIYIFEKGALPVISGTRPSAASQTTGTPPGAPGKLLDVVAEEGPDVQCISLKDQGETVGALVISQLSLSKEVAEALATIVSLIIRQKARS